MSKRPLLFLLLSALIWVMAACQSPTPPATEASLTGASIEDPRTLVVGTHDSFSVSEAVVAQFEAEHNVRLQFLTLGDAGEALNRVILSKDAPLADLFYGVDNTFLSRALDADIFIPYPSPLLDKIPDGLELDPDHRLLPVDYGFVNINADQGWFQEQNLPLPNSLEALALPEYEGLLVVQNPATSSPGLAFLLTTIAHFGEDHYLDFWRALRENDVLITEGWSEAYFTHFTVGSGGSGDRPLVVSYSTSPPADVVYATDGRSEPASVNISPPDGTFQQIEFAGVLVGSSQPELARAFLDYLLDDTFQADIPLQMFVYPANEEVELPAVFAAYGQVPEQPIQFEPAAIETNREAWIQAWTETMLR